MCLAKEKENISYNSSCSCLWGALNSHFAETSICCKCGVVKSITDNKFFPQNYIRLCLMEIRHTHIYIKGVFFLHVLAKNWLINELNHINDVNDVIVSSRSNKVLIVWTDSFWSMGWWQYSLLCSAASVRYSTPPFLLLWVQIRLALAVQWIIMHWSDCRKRDTRQQNDIKAHHNSQMARWFFNQPIHGWIDV